MSGNQGQQSVSDLAKLVVTLSSGVIAVSATFAESLSKGVSWAVLLLAASWVFLGLAIRYGVKSLSVLAQAQHGETQTWWQQTLPHLRKCWRFFQVGLAALIVYGVIVAGVQAFGLLSPGDGSAGTNVPAPVTVTPAPGSATGPALVPPDDTAPAPDPAPARTDDMAAEGKKEEPSE